LKAIPCNGNDTLAMIPNDMQSDSELVLWTLRLHQSYKDKVEHRMKEYKEIERIAKKIELHKLDLREEVSKLEPEVEKLRHDRPLKYIAQKARACLLLNKAKTILRRQGRLCREGLRGREKVVLEDQV